MAKTKKTPEEEVTGEAEVPKKRGGRNIVFDDPSNAGTEIKRVDWIRREVIENGRTRRDVTNELCKIEGREIQFQIVYAATKDYRPVKAPKEEAPATEEAAAE